MTNINLSPRPLFLITVLFISGITVADYLTSLLSLSILTNISLTVSVCLILLFIVSLLSKSLRAPAFSGIMLFGLCFFAGFVRMLIFCDLPANHISRFQADNVPIVLEAEVIEEPRYYPREPDDYSDSGEVKLNGLFTVNSSRISWAGTESAISGRVRISFSGTITDINSANIEYGEIIKVTGIIYTPSGPTNPGEFSRKKYLQRKGIYRAVRIKNINSLEKVTPAKGSLWQAVLSIRSLLSRQADKYLYPETASFLKALILGERTSIPGETENNFMRTGTIHYLSVSGLHLAMLTGFLFLILGLVGVSGKARVLILITCAVLYSALTGFQTPVTRSLVMIVVYLGAELFNRKSNSYNSLALAALMVVSYDPQEVFNAGAQLSFISVLSILAFTGPIQSLLYKRESEPLPPIIPLTLTQRAGKILAKYLSASVAVSAAAPFGVFLIVLHYFHIITPVSILTNIVFSPIVFLIMIVGLIGLPFISFSAFNLVISMLTYVLTNLAGFFSKIPFAYFYLPDVPLVFFWAFYILFFLWLIRDKIPVKTKWFAYLAGSFFLCFIAWMISANIDHTKDNLILTMLDARKGSSMVIETPDGRAILYDAGTSGDRDIGEQVIAPFLWKKGITKIDTLIISHSHLDHISGIKSVADSFPIRQVIVGPYFDIPDLGRDLLDFFKLRQIPFRKITKGASLNLADGIVAKVLGPPPLEARTLLYKNQNDLSLVLNISYNDTRVLLCGDVEYEGIKWLLSKNKEDLAADIIQLPHHGMNLRLPKWAEGKDILDEYSLLNLFIPTVHPQYALANSSASGADDNTIEICRKQGIKVMSNSEYGAISIEISKNKNSLPKIETFLK